MVKATAEPDTLAPDERALSESFWGRSERRARTDHPTARVAGPTRSSVERRRRPKPKQKRGRTFLALLCVGVLLAGVVGAGWWWRNRVHPEKQPAATANAASAPAVAPIARATVPASVIGHRRADGRVDFVSVVGADKAGSKSAVILVPSLTQLEVPGNGLQQVSELQRLGGIPLLDLAIQNALGVATSRSAVMDDPTWQAMLAPAGPLLVTLRSPIAIADPELTLAAGTQTITPEQAATLITRTPAGQSELDHLDTVRTVFNAWFEALRTGDRAAATATAVPQSAPYVAAARVTPRVDTLPVDGIGFGADERFQIRTSETAELVGKALPDAQYRAGTRPRIEIKGPGDAQILAASRCILPAGGDIRLTGTAEPADITSVVYYRDRSQATARQMQAALKTGSVKKADRDLDLVDVTIVVGKDFNGCQ